MGKTIEISSRKLERSGEHFMQRRVPTRTENVRTEQKQKRLRRDGKNTQSNYKKGLNAPGNHDGVVTNLEPDILECEVKWALASMAVNKASGGDRILDGAIENPKR